MDKPYVIEGPKGKTYRTLGGLLRACARACGNQSPHEHNGYLVVDWREEGGEARYVITELDNEFRVDQQLGYDL